MHFKNILLASLFFSLSANAAVLVNQPEPYPQNTTYGSVPVIDYAGNSSGTNPNGTLNISKGYLGPINTQSGTVIVDVTSNSTFSVPSGSYIGVTLQHGASAVPILLTGADTGGGAISVPTVCNNCFGDNYAAIYTQGSTLRLSFTIPNMCLSGSSDICTNKATMVNNYYQASITVKFAVVASTTNGSSVISSTTGTDTTTFTLGIGDVAPKFTNLTCPSNFYFPGDSQIYFFQSLFTSASAGTGTSTNGAGIQYLLAMAGEGSVIDAASGGVTSNPVVAYAPYGDAQTKIDGFINTTNGSDHSYTMIVQPQNRAGIIAKTTESANDPVSCSGVQSQDISGILKESKCFIATAAYHDGRAAPVMMLRKFRDQVLSKFSLGQEFIKTYYQYSPAAAEWAWDKPIIRAVALKLLAPVELMAWAVLKLSSAEETPVVEESYTAKLKKSLPPEENPTTESYSELEKKKLEAKQSKSDLAADADQPYIERMKKKLAAEEQDSSPKDYSAKEKTKLPAYTERESPISMVKEGRDKKLGFGEQPDINNAIGIKIGVTPGMEVVGDTSHTFSQVYGTGFKPEIVLHYERQLFHSENFGSFGLGVDFGMAYSGGNGLLQFGFNGSQASQTPFGFYQVPVLVNGTYRFNLARILRPYITAGGGSILYTETRGDTKHDRKGYTFVYNGSIGASLLLDFFDSGTHRDAYLSSGIQHTYLFAEYLYLNSFKSTVAFHRSGIYSGFLFEF